jgi:hypothetical protein
VTALLIVRLAGTGALGAAVVAAARVRAPRRRVGPWELSRLVVGALALYAAGFAALRGHRAMLATIAFAGGVATATLAAWLSRGHRPDDPPDDGSGPPRSDQPPPPEPDGVPPIDWDRFDRERRSWERHRTAPR